MKGGVRSLRGRLSIWLALQSLAGLACVCVAVYAATALSLQARQSETLLQKESLLRHLLSETDGGASTAELSHKLDEFLIGHRDLSLHLLQSDGTALYVSAPFVTESVPARQLRSSIPRQIGGRESLDAVLTLDISADRRLLGRIRTILLVAALAGVALISAGGYVLVRLGLKPVSDLVEQTRGLAAATLHRRLDGSRQPEELEPLIQQFNELLARLDQAYQRLEGFNADVAHELCTPLATLIGSSELALRRVRDADELSDVLASNLEELQRISGIVRDMLFLSQADRGAAARRRATSSLASALGTVMEFQEALFEEAGLTLQIDGDASGTFDVPLLQRALSNLLGNALRFASSGSCVSVRIAALDADRTSISVINSGPPIGDDHLPRLFDRFYRGDSARAESSVNHGLGLSIVAAIARMHAGSVFARSNEGMTEIGLSIANHARPRVP